MHFVGVNDHVNDDDDDDDDVDNDKIVTMMIMATAKP
jgi:hypothetical protein